MLLSRKKLTEELVDMLMKRCRLGFNVFCGFRIHLRDVDAMENLARYIIRAFLSRLCIIEGRGFSQERMASIPKESKDIYQPKRFLPV